MVQKMTYLHTSHSVTEASGQRHYRWQVRYLLYYLLLTF